MRSASILWCAKCMCRLSPGTVNPDIQAPFIFPPAKTHERAPPWWRPKICTKYRKRVGFQLSGQTFKAKLRQPTGQRQSNVMTQQNENLSGPILFLYYEESLVSSNLNSNLLMFHCAHPNIHTMFKYVTAALIPK